MLFLVVIVCTITLFVFVTWFTLTKGNSYHTPDITGKHVLITGGSSGIGKALAKEVLSHGASVSLVARNQEKLIKTKEELCKCLKSETQKILCFSVDVSEDFQSVKRVIEEAENEAGNIYILFNCAGTSVSYRFDETPIEEFKRMMDINYFGSVFSTRAVIPSMKIQKTGKIVFVSSVAGLFGIYGYTAYSASKFALVGLAQSLLMEVKPFNLSVTLAFPPDTDTPGFAEEEKIKTLETRKISESGGLYSPEHVAKKIFCDTMGGKFVSTVGLEGWLVATACSGMMPVASFLQLLVQVMLMGILRLGCGLFIINCDKIVKKCAEEKERTKKSE